MGCDNVWHFLAKFWPEKITSRDGCFLPIYVFFVYRFFSSPYSGPGASPEYAPELRRPDSRESIRRFARIA